MNLRIKRIIFSTIRKNDGEKIRILTESEIKQIAGRAGRSTTTGLVSAMNCEDLKYIKEVITNSNHTKDERNIEIVDILSGDKQLNKYTFTKSETELNNAYLFPPLTTLLEFTSALSKLYTVEDEIENTELSLVDIFNKFEFFSRVDNNFILKDLNKVIKIAKFLRPIEKASIENHYMFSISPVKVSITTMFYLREYLRDMITKQVVKVPKTCNISMKDFKTEAFSMKKLNYYEDLHNGIYSY